MKFWLPILMIIFLPHLAEAVSISEVAWMGDMGSANHEWIELHNEGETTAVDGWVLSDGMNLNITLSGEIVGGAYVVLERTSEESAQGSAFLIYTGAIVNTGATLVLRTGSGEIVDQVSGGENWQNIGGDNITKETAQYRPSGWVTDAPTPGRENGLGRATEPVTETPKTTTSGSSSSKGSNKKSATIPPIEKPADLELAIKGQTVAYVGQPVRFVVEVDGLTAGESKLFRYAWNFGDSHATTGAIVRHSYNHPGEYVVTVATKKGADEQMARADITVLPVTLTISFGESGVVHVHNNSLYDIDVSGYRVVATKNILFPARSLIKAGGTVTFSGEDLGSWAWGVKLFNREGEVVYARYLDEVEALGTLEVVKSATQSNIVVSESLPSPLANMAASTSTVLATSVIAIMPENISEESRSNNRRSYAVLIGSLLLGLLVMYIKKHH